MIDPRKRIAEIQAYQRRATEEADAADWPRVLEAITVGLANKIEMIEAGVAKRSIVCPRCDSTLHFALVGSNNHLRMACEGKCGMAMME